jgi:hypothetical protein
MRLDSIETAMRRNDVCQLHTFTLAYSGSSPSEEVSRQAAALDFRLLSDSPPHLRPLEITEGNRVSIDPSRPFSPDCRREAGADRFGIVSLAPLLWQGDLPGVEAGAPMMVRDLGPGENRILMEAFPHREPFVLSMGPGGEVPVLRDYQEAMSQLWGQEESGVGPASVGR